MHSIQQLTVSVVVPCRNESRHIRGFLESLTAQQAQELQWEAIIADGMSDDGTREVLNEFSSRYPELLRVVDNPHKYVAPGLNRAIEKARGEIIIRMDAHAEYALDYISTCVRELNRSGADNVGGPALPKADGIRQRAIMLAYKSPLGCGGAKFHDEHYEGYVDTVPFGCWHRETLKRLGMFDEMFVRNQDDELNLRLVRSGGRIWITPAIRSWYWPRNRFRKVFRQYYQYGFWKVAVIRKHELPASWRHVVPGLAVSSGALFVICALVSALLGAREMTMAISSVLALLLLIYGVLLTVAAVAISGRENWDAAPLVPVAITTFHVAYGLGFVAGMYFWCFSSAESAPTVATRLTH